MVFCRGAMIDLLLWMNSRLVLFRNLPYSRNILEYFSFCYISFMTLFFSVIKKMWKVFSETENREYTSCFLLYLKFLTCLFFRLCIVGYFVCVCVWLSSLLSVFQLKVPKPKKLNAWSKSYS